MISHHSCVRLMSSTTKNICPLRTSPTTVNGESLRFVSATLQTACETYTDFVCPLLAPMHGRIIFELLSCKTDTQSSPGEFVRLNINDGITAIPGCDSGPGKSCPLAEFAARTRKRGEEVGNFSELCGLDGDAAERITFLHQKREV